MAKNFSDLLHGSTVCGGRGDRRSVMGMMRRVSVVMSSVFLLSALMGTSSVRGNLCGAPDPEGAFGVTSLMEKELSEVEVHDLRLATYNCSNGKSLEIHYVGDPQEEGDGHGTVFESVAHVFASHVYAILVGEDVYRSELVLSSDDKGRPVVWGVAKRPLEGFTPLWGSKNLKTLVPFNAERNVAIWSLLGMLAPNESLVGTDLKGNITRKDFYMAFIQDPADKVDSDCVETSLGFLKYQCNLDLLKKYIDELKGDRRFEQLLTVYKSRFGGVENVTESLEKIGAMMEKFREGRQ